MLVTCLNMLIEMYKADVKVSTELVPDGSANLSHSNKISEIRIFMSNFHILPPNQTVTYVDA